jgi:methyltransferase (TIGR00027 family)
MLLQRSLNSDGSLSDPVPKPSALRVAILRAAHQLLDTPLIFDDPLALPILGVGEEAFLRSDPSRYDTSRLRGLRTSLVVRSRLAADEWAQSRERGVRQYVILGAGLDTFAYRDQEDDGSRIFESDLPATQEWKRHCLRVAAIPEPAWLTFVPIDFERSTLATELKQATFDESAPAFFSWLGVTMYLEEAAVMSTLRFALPLPLAAAWYSIMEFCPRCFQPGNARASSCFRPEPLSRANAGRPFLTRHLLPASFAH